MKKLRALFLMVLVALGVNLSASCDVISSVPVCQANKVYEYSTKQVPYKVCTKVCVPVKNACNCTVRYVTRTECVTKFRCVTVKTFKGYENVGYYHGQKVVKMWPTKLCRIPIKIVNGCCVVCNIR